MITDQRIQITLFTAHRGLGLITSNVQDEIRIRDRQSRGRDRQITTPFFNGQNKDDQKEENTDSERESTDNNREQRLLTVPVQKEYR